MAATKRRLLILASLVVVILIIAVAFFYRPTRQALERAEALNFRRMSVTRLEDQKTYRFFFATNREPSMEQQSAVEEQFTNERSRTTSFGLFDTRIEATLGIGMLINPTDWFQNEQIRLENVQLLDREVFVEQLREQVDRAPLRSVFITINGFRELFPTALRKTAFLSHVIDIDSPILVFDWPGNQGSTIRGYRQAQEIATQSGDELAETLRLLIDEVAPDRIWLVANSMGAQVVVHAFSTLYQDENFSDSEKELEKVILTAPDVDQGRFNEQFKKEIAALSENLTVYVSSNDRALLMSRVLNRARRLGESTLTPANPDQLQEAADLFELMEADDQLVTLVDVTPINRTRNFHNFSLETPEFFNDLYLRLVNEEVPRSRPRYPVVEEDGRIYWVLTRGQ